MKRYGSLFLVSGLVVALDQWTKYLARTHLAFGQFWLPDGLQWLLPYARLTNWFNRGSAFGMFQEGGPFFAALALVVSALIIYYYPHIEEPDWAVRIALGLQMGGALGNMIDRLHLGHVVDFISVGRFPVFNLADSAITLGVGFMLLGWYQQEKRLRAERAAAAASAEETPDA